MTQLDCLFVLNQNSDLSQIVNLMTENHFTKVMILSTHKLYENERIVLSSFDMNKIIFHTFADFFDDSTSALIDEKALLTIGRSSFDFQRYMDKAKSLKNIEIINRLQQTFSIETIFVEDGLGIDFDCWEEYYEARSIGSDIFSTYQSRSLIYKKFENLLHKNIEINGFEFENKKYIFIGKISRLDFQNITITQRHINRLDLLYLRWTFKGKICTTVHNYRRNLFTGFKKVYVLTDGFFPSNYPESYLNTFDSNVIFVPDNFINEKWFVKLQKGTVLPFTFQKNILLQKVQNKSIKNILLVLGHAGDWTSLINRSDTDLLVEAFTNLAKRFSQLHFTIRPHPTMMHPAHEGSNAINRIIEFVKFINLPNLLMSNSSLEEDLNNHELLVSEYSNTLIQGFQIGKLGVIVNLTNRRNFMSDFTELGFLTLENTESFTHFIEQVSADLASIIQEHNIAIDTYNKMQIDYLNKTNV